MIAFGYTEYRYKQGENQMARCTLVIEFIALPWIFVYINYDLSKKYAFKMEVSD